MTREEAEALIAAFERSTTIGMPELVSLARLGAKVMAPTPAEISFIRGYMRLAPEIGDSQIEQFCAGLRAALAALQEPQP